MPEPAEPRTMRPLDVPRDLVTLAEDAILDGVRIRLGRAAPANYAPGEPIPLSGSEAETAARVVVAAVYPEIQRQAREAERASIVEAIKEASGFDEQLEEDMRSLSGRSNTPYEAIKALCGRIARGEA